MQTNKTISNIEALEMIRDFNAVVKRMIDAELLNQFQTGFEISGNHIGLTSAKFHLTFTRLPLEASQELFDWSKE